jgi:VIT1/CCC1 family predicted Fe2+/Mn2+ transporter
VENFEYIPMAWPVTAEPLDPRGWRTPSGYRDWDQPPDPRVRVNPGEFRGWQGPPGYRDWDNPPDPRARPNPAEYRDWGTSADPRVRANPAEYRGWQNPPGYRDWDNPPDPRARPYPAEYRDWGTSADPRARANPAEYRDWGSPADPRYRGNGGPHEVRPTDRFLRVASQPDTEPVRLMVVPDGERHPPSGGQHRELRDHRDVSGGWLRPAVFGAMDGLVTNSSLIAGIGGGGAGSAMIVLAGLAGLIAGAFSMATGEYISVTSQNDLTKAEVELEKMQHFRDPVGKLRKMTEVFIKKGVTPALAQTVARQISADPDRAVDMHVREELGIDPSDLPSPWTAAGASFASFTVGALIPLSPFLVGYPMLVLALVLAGLTALVGGGAVARLTERPILAGGLRQFTAAFVATGMAFVVGHLVGGHVT